MRQLDHGLALEFAAVGGQPDLARLFDDAARHAHFAEVVVAQGTVGLDAGNADQADIDLELARSEEHTSELQSLMRISYAVFCLKKKKNHSEYRYNHKNIIHL